MATSGKPSIFISYASTDRRLADLLRKHLADDRKLGVVMDREIEIGEDWRKPLTAALDTSDVVILLVSPAFLQSQWNLYEAGVALAKERSNQGKVIPILLGDVEPSSLPASLRRMVLLDGREVDQSGVLGQLDEMLTRAAA